MALDTRSGTGLPCDEQQEPDERGLAAAVLEHQRTQWLGAVPLIASAAAGYGVLLLVALLIRLSASVGGEPDPLKRTSLTLDTADSAAILAAFAGMVIAIALAARSPESSSPPSPRDIARARLWRQLVEVACRACVVVGLATMAGGFVASINDLLGRLSLLVLSGLLAVVAVTAAPPIPLQSLEQEIERLAARAELHRLRQVIIRWAPPRSPNQPPVRVTRRWLGWQVVGWVVIVAAATAGWAQLTGGFRMTPSGFRALFLFTAMLTVVAATGCYLAYSTLSHLADRLVVLAAGSALLLLCWLVGGGLATYLMAMDGRGASEVTWPVTALVGLAFLGAPLSTLFGSTSRLPRWRAGRIGLAVRRSVQAQSQRRRSQLLARLAEDSGHRADAPRSFLYRAQRRYDELTGVRSPAARTPDPGHRPGHG